MKEEEFNVGDWVVVIGDARNGHCRVVGNCYQIETTGEGSKDAVRLLTTLGISDGNGNMRKEFVRKAEPYEIPGYTPSPNTYSYLTPILKKLKIK